MDDTTDGGRLYLEAVQALGAIAASPVATDAEAAQARAALDALHAVWKDGVAAAFAVRTAQYRLLADCLRRVAAAAVTDPLRPVRERIDTLVEAAGQALLGAEADDEAVNAGRAGGPGDAPDEEPPAPLPAAPRPPPVAPPAGPPAAPPVAPAPGGSQPPGSPVPAALWHEYAGLFAGCAVRPEHAAQVERAARRLRAGRAQYGTVAAATGVPWWVIGLLHEMECACDFGRHLHNGDPLGARTVRVPAGLPKDGAPPFAWAASAADALRHDGFLGWRDWTVPAVLYKLERYNGWGYRKHHPEVKTPYLWSCTGHYSKGKYVADGHFDPEAVSRQAGAAAILRRLIEAGDLED